MKLQINLILKGRPRPKKNNQIATKQRFIIQNKAYRDYEKDCIAQLKGQWKGKPIDSRVYVYAGYYLEDRRESDLYNLDNAIADILERAGILENDKLVTKSYTEKIAIDRENPRVEITIITGLPKLKEVGEDSDRETLEKRSYATIHTEICS